MLEIILLIISVYAIIATLAVGYFYAESKSDKRFITKQAEWVTGLKEENREMLNKLLAKQGITPLGYQHVPAKPKPSRDRVTTPQVITRRQAEGRASQKPDYIQRAAEIIEQ
jgi:hypothetical protein